MNGCVDPSLSFSLVKLINEDGRLLPFPSDGSRPKKLLHFCQGMYRARSAYALPNKGMVTQQREVSLSLFIPPWHNAICSTYFRPVAFFRFYPRLFSFHPSPPYHPFVSTPRSLSLLSPHHLSILATIGASLVAHSNRRRKTPAKPLADICFRDVVAALSNCVRWDRR